MHDLPRAAGDSAAARANRGSQPLNETPKALAMLSRNTSRRENGAKNRSRPTSAKGSQQGRRTVRLEDIKLSR
jgi:hypothetical protein